MYKDFEGRTEEEARNKAIEELNLNGEDFDVEVIETVKKGSFKKPQCKIRVYYGEDDDRDESKENEREELE